jgi:hypothetical protein
MNLQDHSKTFARITRFPDGDVKISGCHRPVVASRARAPIKLSRVELQEKAAKRAAVEVRDIAKYFGLTHLWTLTYRGAVTSRAVVTRHWKRWQRLVREVLPEFECLSVLEFHKGGGVNDGGIHIHFAVNQFMPVEVFRAAWWRIVGEGRGNVDIQRRGGPESPKAVGGYLSKYVSKDFDDLPRDFGQHRYFRSKGLTVIREKICFFRGQFREHREALRVMAILEAGRDVTSWLSEDEFQFVIRSYG